MKKNKHRKLAYREAFLTGRIGIRGKLLIYLAVLVAFIISLVWVCQIALLFNFYKGYRASQISTTADVILQNIDNEELENLADRLSADNDVCLLLLDEKKQTVISIDHVRNCLLHQMDDGGLSFWVSQAPEDGTALIKTMPLTSFRNEQYNKARFTGKVPEENANTGMSMLYVQKVSFADGSTGTLMINAIITPLGSTQETLRHQFLLIMVAILVATVLIGYGMSYAVSRPIIETNEAARELSRSRYKRPPHSGGYREIAELNDTLIQTAEDLSKVEDLQKELIANISHDLRTPLTLIQGYAETMRDLPDEMTAENMQVIIDETNRLASLVNEVLDFSRLRTGSLQMNLQPFELTKLIRGIAERIGAMTEAEGYTIVFEPQEELWVTADSARISQVIYNLMGNAMTYTGPDKTVTVEQLRMGDSVRISVSDSGPGIAPEELPYIWDRYYRTRETHKRAVVGSGLGLNICRSILESHEAKYGVHSLPGAGTTFWFCLPLSSAPAENSETEKKPQTEEKA